MDEIFDFFLDKYPVLQAEDNQYWYFKLDNPSTLDWYIDSKLPTYLLDVLKLKLEDIPSYYLQKKINKTEIVISMFHSHALLGVSNFHKNNPGSLITSIIHIDDHTDLMPALSNANVANSLSILDVNEPMSVINSINKGTVGMGNFLNTYILNTPPGKIYHVKKQYKDNDFYYKESTINSVRQKENIGESIYFKDSVVLNPKRENTSKWKYELLKEVPKLLPLGQYEKVWLDIDLDYFSNRYNKDSDWNLMNYYNPSYEEVVHSLDEMLNHLKNAPWFKNIVVLTIAYSPGFFPSEYFSIANSLLVEPLFNLLNEAILR